MKAIYQPKGKAAEYAKYAVNFYVGCSNDCDYCYCKRGLLGHAMGQPTPTLKKCFKDESDAYKSFMRELNANLDEYRKHGIFFTFTSDPLLPETQNLTNASVLYAVAQGVPCKILTKRADFEVPLSFFDYTGLIAYGFTLTGCDELEPHASTNEARLGMISYLHERGFYTFASIEPVIDLEKSFRMIQFAAYRGCDLFKIGLLSGNRYYTPYDVSIFMNRVHQEVFDNNWDYGRRVKIYWKDSVVDYVKCDRNKLPDICVTADYNLFK